MALSDNATISAIVGAFSGGFAGYLASKILQARDTKQRHADTLDELILDLKGDARTYWSRDGQDRKQESDLERLSRRIRDKAVKHEKLHNKNKREKNLKDLCLVLHNEVTGGTFAQVSRTADPLKVTRIEILIDRVRDYFI